jgi:hypothetical protein
MKSWCNFSNYLSAEFQIVWIIFGNLGTMMVAVKETSFPYKFNEEEII